MKIRKFKENDFERLVDLYRVVYTEKPYKEKWSRKTLRKKLLENVNWMKVFVSIDENKVVGFVMFYIYDWYDGKRAYIEELLVDKKYRGKSLGKNLMKYLEKYLKKLKVKKMFLNVDKRTKAYRLYKNLKYRDAHNIMLMKRLR